MSTIIQGDCLEKMRKIDDNYISAIITDPPYGLKFMGKSWDHGVPGIEFWQEMLRVTKPGGYLLAFGGTRTYHRMTCAIEDAGWEIRDCIMWIYGSGFCKSHNFGCVCKGDTVQYNHEKDTENTSKMQNLSEGISQESMLGKENEKSLLQSQLQRKRKIEESSSFQQQWEGKEESSERTENGEESCLEGRSNLQEEQGKLHRAEICEMSNRIHSDVQEGRVCDGAPFSDGKTLGSGFTENRSSSSQRSQYEKQRDREFGIISGQSDAQNRRVETCEKCGRLKNFKGWGTALKPAYEPIVVAMKPCDGTFVNNAIKHGIAGINIDACRVGQRWPANVILDEEAGAMLDEQTGIHKGTGKTCRSYHKPSENNCMSGNNCGHETLSNYGDSGGSSRFFYCPKASSKERNEGLEGMPSIHCKTGCGGDMPIDDDGKERDRFKKSAQNFHPTVKPIKLMEYLIKLVTVNGGTILDPFAGSGTTILAAKNLGIDAIGIEMNEEYCEIARKRIS